MEKYADHLFYKPFSPQPELSFEGG